MRFILLFLLISISVKCFAKGMACQCDLCGDKFAGGAYSIVKGQCLADYTKMRILPETTDLPMGVSNLQGEMKQSRCCQRANVKMSFPDILDLIKCPACEQLVYLAGKIRISLGYEIKDQIAHLCDATILFTEDCRAFLDKNLQEIQWLIGNQTTPGKICRELLSVCTSIHLNNNGVNAQSFWNNANGMGGSSNSLNNIESKDHAKTNALLASLINQLQNANSLAATNSNNNNKAGGGGDTVEKASSNNSLKALQNVPVTAKSSPDDSKKPFLSHKPLLAPVLPENFNLGDLRELTKQKKKSSVAHTIRYSIEKLVRVKQGGECPRLSIQQSIDCGRNPKSLQLGFEYVAKNGLVSMEQYNKKLMPNGDIIDVEETEDEDDPCRRNAANMEGLYGYGIMPIIPKPVYKDKDYEKKIKNFLVTKNIAIPMVIYANFDFGELKSQIWSPNDDDCKLGEEGVDQHAIVIVGYGREEGQSYFRIANWYGTEWGEMGYGKITTKSVCFIGQEFFLLGDY